MKIKLSDLPEHIAKSMKPGMSYAIDIIEDEPQEPERELPEPKPGGYFIAEGRAAYRFSYGSLWRFMTDGTGHGRDYSLQEMDQLPADWQSLPDLIAKAARCDDVEKELLQEQYARRHWEESSDANFARVEKLEATLDIYQASNDDLKAQLQARDSRIAELEARLKQQDAEKAQLSENLDYWQGQWRELNDRIKVIDETINGKAQEAG